MRKIRFSLDIKRYEDVKNYELPVYQRKNHRRVKINEIKKEMLEKNVYCFAPITVNENNEIIDGGHRYIAFCELIKDDLIKDGIEILTEAGASKESFLSMNNGTSVSLAHKIMIIDNIEKMKNNGFSFTYGMSTMSSFGIADFGRAYHLLHGGGVCRQCTQKKLLEFLNNAPYEKLVDTYIELEEYKRLYISNLEQSQKFLQKMFLYFVWLLRKNILVKDDFRRIVKKLPSSMGGDIGTGYNKSVFLDCYNYNKKINRLDFSVFDV